MFCVNLKVILSVVAIAAVVLFGFFGGPVFAAEIEDIIIPPVRIVTRGADRPIELRGLDVKSNIAGGYAWTTVEMTFFNPNSRVLEGELQFPLADGQTITGFALGVGEDKKEVMRDAVPVERQRGR